MAAEDAQHPFAILNDLDEPPETWRLVRDREARLKKSLQLNELRALLQYHGYGFECKKHFGLKQKYIDHLHKILYYTQNGLGNNSAFTEQGIICAGPVGPGTLSSGLRVAKRLPAWYLTEQAALNKIQPHPSLRSTLLDSTDRPSAQAACYHIVSGTPIYSEANAAVNEDSISARKSVSVTDSIPPKGPLLNRSPPAPTSIDNSPRSEEVIVLSGDPNAHDNEVLGDHIRAENSTNADSIIATEPIITRAQNFDLDKRIWQMIAEQTRKAIVVSAYSGLNVVPDAFLRPTPFLLATTDEDLLRKLEGNNIASSHVSIRTTIEGNYTIDEGGAHLRYYGRGPTWHANSCYWDSIIVSCLFLNAGFTFLDQGKSPERWENGLTKIERAFLDVLRMDWSFFDTRTSIAQREMYLDLFDREWKDGGLTSKPKPRGEMDSPAARWNDIAGPFNQFSFSAHQRRQPCACQKRAPHDIERADVRYITPPYQRNDGNGVTVATLLQRWSHFVLPHCQSGAKETKMIIHGNLPLRLVLQVTTGTRLLEHTSQNVSFSYIRVEPGSTKGVPSRVTYRWLGGVYCSGSHFRVFWNDSTSGALTVESLRMYDGMEAAGAILGNISPAGQLEPIPDGWMKYCPPLLFYEQVVDPGSLALEAAQAVITDMIAKQPHRSVFPNTFFPATSHTAETNIGIDALLPRELSNAVLKVEGPSTGFHNTPIRPESDTAIPPATPENEVSKTQISPTAPYGVATWSFSTEKEKE